jgi:hypothetical protein
MNLKQAKSLKPGDIVHYTGGAPCGSTKRTVVRYRVTGQTKTWKRSPEKIRIPIKHGLYSNGYINEDNLTDFHREDECPLLLERFETDSDAELGEDQTPEDDEDIAVIPSFVDKDHNYVIDLTDGTYLLSNDKDSLEYGEIEHYVDPETGKPYFEESDNSLALRQFIAGFTLPSDEPEEGVANTTLTSDMIGYIAAQDQIRAPELQKVCRNLVKMHQFNHNAFSGKSFMITFPKHERTLLAAMLGSWCTTL